MADSNWAWRSGLILLVGILFASLDLPSARAQSADEAWQEHQALVFDVLRLEENFLEKSSLYQPSSTTMKQVAVKLGAAIEKCADHALSVQAVFESLVTEREQLYKDNLVEFKPAHPRMELLKREIGQFTYQLKILKAAGEYSIRPQLLRARRILEQDGDLKKALSQARQAAYDWIVLRQPHVRLAADLQIEILQALVKQGKHRQAFDLTSDLRQRWGRKFDAAGYGRPYVNLLRERQKVGGVFRNIPMDWNFDEQLSRVNRIRWSIIKKRFVDNGDGTVSDMLTGLMWIKNAGKGGNYEVVEKRLANASVGDYTDWRLPSTFELATILVAIDFDLMEAEDSKTYFWSNQGFIARNNSFDNLKSLFINQLSYEPQHGSFDIDCQMVKVMRNVSSGFEHWPQNQALSGPQIRLVRGQPASFDEQHVWKYPLSGSISSLSITADIRILQGKKNVLAVGDRAIANAPIAGIELGSDFLSQRGESTYNLRRRVPVRYKRSWSFKMTDRENVEHSIAVQLTMKQKVQGIWLNTYPVWTLTVDETTISTEGEWVHIGSDKLRIDPVLLEITSSPDTGEAAVRLKPVLYRTDYGIPQHIEYPPKNLEAR